MRIVGGYLGGRHFNPKMKKWPTRPTTDQAKEALFNILHNKLDFESIKCLDLFGGTGNISFELASRGCLDITCIDKYRACTEFVKDQSVIFNTENEIKVIQSDVLRFIKQTKEKFGLIFADPPYDWNEMSSFPALLLSLNILSSDSLFVLEHDNKVKFDHIPEFIESRNYGQTVFSFFSKHLA